MCVDLYPLCLIALWLPAAKWTAKRAADFTPYFRVFWGPDGGRSLLREVGQVSKKGSGLKKDGLEQTFTT
jgi:hypothetical protein